ncbi:TonB-dependent receptor [Altererythrobacter salegens]|uniref:TonB-dependent receptor n=1 Tax=Croceibacterium salegens TaxID=1737568 RepID=A0A6I4SY41_9SPHN|nr:TonB-dependent receptor [Croceibacterium salegens]MXO60358.1 TonB-dependent receptor [Croceibacterium salegens]
MKNNVTLASGSIIAMIAALLPGTGFAQDVPQDEQRGTRSGEEIVVTAEKREQTLLEVPQAVSVVGGEQLEEQHADNFSDYVKLVPGLQMQQARPGETRLVIRGVNTGSVTSTVGIYMDETPFGSSSGLVNGSILAGDFDTFDLARIEVLRGPQGTFYGANSLSGVLKFVTNEPSTAGLEVRARGGVETTRHGETGYLGNLVVNVPLSDAAAIRASGFYHKYGGFIDSIGTGGSDVEKDINDTEVYGGRASLLLMPSDTFDVRLTAVMQNVNAHAPSSVEADPDTLDILYGNLTQSQFVPEFSKMRYRVYNATGTLDLGFGELTSSTSYSTQKQQLRNDYTPSLGFYIEFLTGIPNDFVSPQRTNLEKFTQEVRLAGESSSVDWLVGAYYSNEDGLIEQNFDILEPGTLTPIPLLGLIGFASIDSGYKELAGFANVTVHLGDRFEVGLGGRYSHNKQTVHQVQDGLLVGGAADLGITKSDENVFTWSIAPRFELSDNASLYVRVANGFRPGGPNILPPGAPDAFRSYDSDSVVSYEAGIKAQSGDGMFSADLAVFHIDWDDIQLLVSDAATGFNFNGNGGKAKSEGVEASATFLPVTGLRLAANAAYTNAKLTQDTQIGGLDGDPLPYSPKFSTALVADYTFSLSGDTEAHIGGSFSHLSKRTTEYDEAYRIATGSQRQLPGYEVVDLTAGVDFGQVNLDVYVKNLAGSTGRTSIGPLTTFGLPTNPNGAITTGIVRPRTVGVTLGVEL